MPATAGRVRMPANNRVHSSAALQTHGIWQSAIGYDPYASTKEVGEKKGMKKGSDEKVDASSSDPKDGENTYASFQGLLALAKVTNSSVDEYRGACQKCGRVGHLTYQCRNYLSMKDDKDTDPERFEAGVRSEIDKLKKMRGKMNGGQSEESESESEEESESEDSDYDSEMEREIAKKFGKKVISKLKKKDSDDDVSDREDKKKRGRSRKRGSVKKVGSDSDSKDSGGKTRRKEKRRRDGPLEVKDEVHHRWKESRIEKGSTSHRRSKNTDKFEHSDERRNRRAAADYDKSGLDDSRVGREREKRPEKKTRKHRYEDSDERMNSWTAADCDNSGLEDSRVGRERMKRPEKKTRKHNYEREDRYAV